MPHKVRVIPLALLLLTGIAIGQTVPDAPSATVGAFPSVAVANTSSSMVATPPAARKPWIDLTVADSAYWNYTYALVGSTIVNVEMTARCSEQHKCLTQIADGASRGDLYAYTLSTDAALSYLTYKLKTKTRFWAMPDALFIAANLFSAGRSYDRLQIQIGPVRKSALPPFQGLTIPIGHK